MTYLTTVQAAAAACLSEQRIRVLCAEGRIAGAMKIGKAWLIPAKFKITPSQRQSYVSALASLPEITSAVALPSLPTATSTLVRWSRKPPVP